MADYGLDDAVNPAVLAEALGRGRENFTAYLFLQILTRWKEGANPDRAYQLAKQIAADLVVK